MKLKPFLFDDESGVSPVIGVILMVAITVILAAVIATFVLGLGEQISDTSPQASFELQDDGNTLVHAGGQELPGEGTLTWTATKNGSLANSQGPYSAGDPVVDGGTYGKLTWSNGDTSAILYDGTN
ncbi:type IV pilin N-terminal domain-containing protein [Halorhabdus sp. BNX81]|uniref:type IV pilin N-terminal domain-containing protein n=1 Tax=Halorhabdus sp. BNX81 TaxID=2980181 RepID=UPI0023DD2042|nr:type IV pilin N-terminal domain-containing protein [Halorhabdus sp. BNX81]WEL21081.1 Pilin/Flagellin, FlaG/FlaF family [Halorhabdus sp. BNX81]